MNSKEKAKELVDRFYDIEYTDWDGYPQSLLYMAAKQCALIACLEVIKYCERWGDMGLDDIKEQKEIMEEIEKL